MKIIKKYINYREAHTSTQHYNSIHFLNCTKNSLLLHELLLLLIIIKEQWSSVHTVSRANFNNEYNLCTSVNELYSGTGAHLILLPRQSTCGDRER